MTKSKARDLILELKSELNTNTVTQQFWMDKVQGYVQFIFGDNTQSIALPMFGTYYWDRPYSQWDTIKQNAIVEELSKLFDKYLEMIEKGVFFRKNLFSDWNNPSVIATLFFGTVGLLMSFGLIFYQWGNLVGVSVTKSELECRLNTCDNYNIELVDSIVILNQKISISAANDSLHNGHDE